MNRNSRAGRAVGVAFTLTTLAVLLAALTTLHAAEEPKKWQGSAALGFTLTDGNSETILFTATANGLRKWDKNELTLGADAAYGEQSNNKNVESARGYSQYNRLFTERMFGYLRAELLHDAIADVEYRLTVSPGAGYYFVKNDRVTLSGELGPGFIYEKQGGEESAYWTARVAERFTWKINDRARLWQSVEFLPQVDDLDNYLLIGEIGVEADITRTVALRVTFQDTYDNEPAPGRKKNDIRLVTSVAYKF